MRLVKPSGVRVIALLMVLALIAAACTSGTEEETTTSADENGTETTAADTDDGDGTDTTAAEGDDTAGDEEITRLVFGVAPPEQGEGNNPNRDIQPNDEFQLKPMYENLISVDPETAEWGPMLAEDWEFNDAGDQLIFHLREGVQFHNDFGEMTADDVVFSLTDLIEPEGALSGVAEAVRNAVEEFEVIDDHTVAFHLTDEGVTYAFFEGLSYGAAGAVIKSQADWESRGGGSPATPSMGEEPIAGTGPYQFVERTLGQNVVFERVPYEHWREDGDFQEIEYRYIAEEATRLSSLLAGEIHLTELSSDLTAEATSQGMERIRSALPGSRFGLALLGCYYVEDPQPGEPSAEVFTSGERRYPDSPWCNVDIRRAASKAIDRQALVDAFFGGEAEPAMSWYWLPEQEDSWNPEWSERFPEELGYDPEGARELLDSVGEPVSIQVYAKDDISEAVGTMLSDVGFDVELVSMDSAQFAEQREAREFDRMIERDDTGSENVTGFEPAGYANQSSGRAVEMVEWDTMYEEVLQELDDEARAELWGEFGNVIFDNVPHVPLVRSFTSYVANPDVVCGYTFPGANMSAPYSFVAHIEAC